MTNRASLLVSDFHLDLTTCWSLTLFRRLVFSRLFKCISHVHRELQFKPSDWNRPACGGDASTGLLRRAVCVGEGELGGAINPFTECRTQGERDGRLPLSLHLPFLDENCLSKCKRAQALCFKGRQREGERDREREAQNNPVCPLLFQISRSLWGPGQKPP